MLSQQIGRLAASGLHTAINVQNNCSIVDTVKGKVYSLVDQYLSLVYWGGGILFVVLVSFLMFYAKSEKRSSLLERLGWIIAVVIFLSMAGTVYGQLTGSAACS